MPVLPLLVDFIHLIGKWDTFEVSHVTGDGFPQCGLVLFNLQQITGSLLGYSRDDIFLGSHGVDGHHVSLRDIQIVQEPWDGNYLVLLLIHPLLSQREAVVNRRRADDVKLIIGALFLCHEETILIPSPSFIHGLFYGLPVYGYLADSDGNDEVVIYCAKERVVKRLPKNRNIGINEQILSRLMNHFGEKRVKVVEKPIENIF